MSERAKYIPLRLTYDERKLLRLAEAALKVSNYTNVVDDVALTEKDARRRQKQLQNISAMLAGLVVACDYMMGQDVLEEGKHGDIHRLREQRDLRGDTHQLPIKHGAAVPDTCGRRVQ